MTLTIEHLNPKKYEKYLKKLGEPVGGTLVADLDALEKGVTNPDIKNIPNIRGLYELRFLYNPHPRLYFLSKDKGKTFFIIHYGIKNGQSRDIKHAGDIIKRLMK